MFKKSHLGEIFKKVYGWTEGRTNGQTNGWTDRNQQGQSKVSMVSPRPGKVRNGNQKSVRITISKRYHNRRTDGRTDGQTDGRTDMVRKVIQGK